MSARTDPTRLSAELIAAGLSSASFTGCRSGGLLETICWSPGHPTPAELATATGVLAAHDPDAAAKADAAERARVAHLLTIIEDINSPVPLWRAAVAEHARILTRRLLG